MREARSGGARRLTVLLAGTGAAQLTPLRDILGAFGHRLIEADSGASACAQFARHKPDLVILDLDMPESGGYPTVAALRGLDTVRWVPIWCLSRAVDETRRASAIRAGADACFNNPVSVPVFTARLEHIAHYVSRQGQLANRQAELQGYYEAVEDEIRSARSIMDRLLSMHADHAEVLQTWVAPAVKFSGDAVVAERSPDGSLKVLVADGVGHGLSAALNVLPVGRAFKSMAQKGFGLSALVTELNHTIRRDLPSHRFVAATLINIDASQGLIEVWNGGNPACVMLDGAGNVIDTWPSRHLPLGIVDSDELDPQPERRSLRPDGRLVMFSDGVVEAINDKGVAFGEQALFRVLAGASDGERMEAVKLAIVEHLAGRPASDDVTLAVLDCGAEIRRRAALGPAPAPAADTADHAGTWQLALQLESARLKTADMVPILQEFLGRIDPRWSRDESSFALVSDLYAGALEQGLLKMDAAIKEQPDGLNLYAREREARLQELPPGMVHIQLARLDGAGQGRLAISISDAADYQVTDLSEGLPQASSMGGAPGLPALPSITGSFMIQ